MQNQLLDLPFEQIPEGPQSSDQTIPFQDDNEEDPPLLQGSFSCLWIHSSCSLELGIEPKEFVSRLLSVLNPFGKVNPEHWMDGDMAGYVIFVFALGFLLLLVCFYLR